jgi:hypothetical protein
MLATFGQSPGRPTNHNHLTDGEARSVHGTQDARRIAFAIGDRHFGFGPRRDQRRTIHNIAPTRGSRITDSLKRGEGRENGRAYGSNS